MDKKSVRILVIGGGSIGERHVRCFLQTGRADVGLCELREDLCRAVAERYQLAMAYTELDRALEHQWDTALIASPAHTHVPIARRLIEMGIGTLIEKPLAVELAETDDLESLAAHRRVRAGVAFVYRSHPALQAMHQAVTSGRFGRPIQIISHGGHNFPHARPAYENTYYRDHRTGGGAIQDALSHHLNAMEWFVGRPDRVACHAGRLSLTSLPVEDTVHLLAQYGEVMGVFSFNQHQYVTEVEQTVVCERGVAKFELVDHRWRWADRPGATWNDEPVRLEDRDHWFRHQAHGWLDAIENGAEFVCPIADARDTLATVHASLQSAREGGQWVDVATSESVDDGNLRGR